ncbi:Ig domain-containing protein [Kitasatospora acidiphila]|uniref:Ig domain-containing protein n=1 Tax=Kitasatospora acidiphila TaxID=2567942 RepID=UPI0015F0D01E|nr:Ig domain-containing protein [Kitasatospora acidiphila]
MGTPQIRGAARAALTGVAALSLITGVAMTAAASPAGTSSAASQSVANPYNPSNNHSYRHGVIPTIQQNAKMKSWDASHPTPNVATGPETLSYGGAIDGVGVNSGHAKVYLVFYGSQWGSQSTDSNGNAKFSGDPDGAAGAAQQMFKGIGTNNELWSADLTQWCDGPNVASGATSCPSNANFIPYQSGGVLSGVWEDTSVASPSTASGNQLGQEAVNAAAHFGNTASGSNRNAYYVIMSPTGTNPDSYQNQYCAWHDYTGDSTLSGGAVNSPYGDLAFSNQPYNMDSGAGCGVGFVNSPGTLDGWTITLGHEWHEMMSDMNPAGGWTNHVSGSSFNGQENSDECAWLSPGTTGGAANISFGSFGTYPEQASWSNDTNSCAISHPIVNGGGGGNTVTVTNPGSQSSTVGTAVNLQIRASDSGSGQTLTYSATGLPAGLSISSSGDITGTPTTAGTSSVTVTAKDGTGASGNASFSWTVSGSGGGGGAITNGGFETGNLTGWTSSGSTSASGSAAHSGSYGAMVGSANPSNTSSIAQTFTAPSGSSKLSFWYSNTCPDTVTYDWATATLKDNTTGTTTTVLAKTCAASSAWVNKTASVTAGHSYTLTLTNKDDNYPGDPTYTYYDDVTVS